MIDPYKNKEKYLEWKGQLNGKVDGINEINSQLLLSFLEDMECGMNVAANNKKGSRSYIRLSALKLRLILMFKNFEERYDLKDITKITERQLCLFFSDMRNGITKKKNGQDYKSTADYVKIFKSFWHWWIKINYKKGIEVKDITSDLDSSREKPRWVYLTEEQVKRLSEKVKYEYKVLIWFLFDTGIRAPTELMNIKISDFYKDFKELQIRDEISKTFGRRIRLMLCSELIKEFIKFKQLGSEDYLFNIKPYSVNQYLKRLSKQVFGDEKSPAGQKYSELTMYDFRHISCCYWLPRYKSESALKYRFGWKKSDKIHYYNELLGMKDTIAEEDLLIDITKTEIEKRLLQTENEKEMLKERVQILEGQMRKILELTNQLGMKMDS